MQSHGRDVPPNTAPPPPPQLLPFQVVILKPHVGVLGVSSGHDAVPELPSFLHVITQSGLRHIRGLSQESS